MRALIVWPNLASLSFPRSRMLRMLIDELSCGGFPFIVIISVLKLLSLSESVHSVVRFASRMYDFPSSRFGVSSDDVLWVDIESLVKGRYSLIIFPFISSIFALIEKFVAIPESFDALILNEKSDELSNRAFSRI